MHRVLEWAARPGATALRLADAAAAATRLFGLPAGQAADIAAVAAAVLRSPECAPFFDPGQFAWAGNEVPVVAAGAPGRIDRLVAFDGAAGRTWWVLDYKLASAPAEVAAYREQLAAYAEAVRALQPRDTVRAGFITAAGRLVALGG